MPRTILVTGASTGIGEACAVHLAAKGHRVYAGVRKQEDADRLRAQSSNLVPVFCDVTDEAQIEAVAKQIDAEAGELHGLVNNAGVGRGGPLEYLPMSEWREQLEINVIGQIAVTKAMLPLLRKGKGRVVFIGSIGGKVATPLMGPYNASKFAIEAIGASLRQELHPWGLHVSVVEPGAIKTPIWHKAYETADRLEGDLPDEARDRYRPHLDAIRKGFGDAERRGASPDLVAKVVEHALFARRPKTRYPVGTDARIGSALARLLPDRAREALVRRVGGG